MKGRWIIISFIFTMVAYNAFVSAFLADRLYGTGNYGGDLYGIGNYTPDNVTARETRRIDIIEPIIIHYIVPLIIMISFIMIYIFKSGV